MKRPGGFDREPERGHEDTAPQPPSVRPPGRAVVRPRAHQGAGAVPVGGSASDAAQATDLVTDQTPGNGVAAGFDPDHQDTDLLLDEDLPTPSTGTNTIATVTQDARASAAKALAWVGVGAPKDPVRAADKRVRAAARARRGRERRERQRFLGQLRKQRRGWLIGGGAVLGLALFVAVCAFTPLTAVREIHVTGANAVPEKDLTRALERFDGVPLALVDDAEVHRALEVFPLIQRYQVERVPPHTLVVDVTERVPVITVERNGSFDQYDAAGVKVGTGDAASQGVPLASGAATDLSSPAFIASARVVRDMTEDLRARVTGVEASSAQDITLKLDSGLEVVWGGDSDTRRKSVVLESMTAALGSRPIEVIDVSSPDAPVFR